MKHIVITGATGFIGYNLINKLLSIPYKITAVLRKNSKNLFIKTCDNVNVIEATMSEYKNLDRLISEPCDCFFSLAWNGIRGDERNNKDSQKKSYLASLDSLKCAINMGCKTFFTAGSQAEYGLIYDKIDETALCHPVTEYGKYKLQFFNEAKSECKRANVKLFEPRFFSLYGPGDFKGTLISSLITKFLNNEECAITECIQMWDFLYISDAINALILLMEGHHDDGIYNIASGDYHPLKYFVELMHMYTKSSSILKYGEIPYDKTGMVSIQPDVTKLMSIGWKPYVSFKEGIANIINTI